jgi:hypothetical protein
MEENNQRASEHVELRTRESLTRDKEQYSPSRTSRSRRGKTPGEGNEGFEAFDLFRSYFDSRLSDLEHDITS